MSRQVSRGSPGEYQADDEAGVARLLWRVSGMSDKALWMRPPVMAVLRHPRWLLPSGVCPREGLKVSN